MEARTVVTDPSSTTKYIYHGLDPVGERTTSAVNVSNDYVFAPGIDEPLAKRDISGNITYFVVDGLGSVTSEVDPSATFLSTGLYRAWGEGTAPSTSMFGYTAREKGPYGMWYYRARVYDPNVGRFISEDAIQQTKQIAALFDAVQLYGYANNDPITFVDPSGLSAAPPCGDMPKATGKPAADCIARYNWGICNLKHAQRWTGVASVFGALGIGAAGAVLAPGPGKVPAAICGFVLGYATGKAVSASLTGPLTEIDLRRQLENCLRNAKAQQCIDAANPVGPCPGT
jgi:RHS repeat-associated protein